MFDIAWTEMLLIAVITIVVVGPKDLPKVMRAVGNMMSKARRYASQFQADMNSLAQDAELEDLRKQAEAYHQTIQNPKKAVEKLIDPTTGREIKPKRQRLREEAEARNDAEREGKSEDAEAKSEDAKAKSADSQSSAGVSSSQDTGQA